MRLATVKVNLKLFKFLLASLKINVGNILVKFARSDIYTRNKI